jgi:hypothetical protein
MIDMTGFWESARDAHIYSEKDECERLNRTCFSITTRMLSRTNHVLSDKRTLNEN